MPGLLKIAVYITITIIIFFVLRKKDKKPSQLEMGLSKHRNRKVIKNALSGVRKVTAEVVGDDVQGRKDLAVIYYKKRPYNAWEVLGLPRGAGLVEVKEAYARKSLTGEDKALLSLAFKKVKDLSGG